MTKAGWAREGRECAPAPCWMAMRTKPLRFFRYTTSAFCSITRHSCATAERLGTKRMSCMYMQVTPQNLHRHSRFCLLKYLNAARTENDGNPLAEDFLHDLAVGGSDPKPVPEMPQYGNEEQL